ncbi:MAG: cobalamin biosynthesis protein CbiA [Desulfosarcinaceae bacterium]|nr:cobalamin biosynthesis protein CbiA [Desulfosarcinaceae bacterium]
MITGLNGIVIIVGNYGSGKTEVSINLAVQAKRAGRDVRVADLDLVNPYFRTREARALFDRMGIPLVLPPGQYMQADLPILDPAVAGLIRRDSDLTILDVGGDDVGATVLAALADALRNRDATVLQVINPNRPYTDTVAGCLRVQAEIESRSKLKVTGWIGNANLIDDTTLEDLYAGYTFAKQVADRSGLPLFGITAMGALAAQVDPERLTCPILPMQRQLVPPWLKAGKI